MPPHNFSGPESSSTIAEIQGKMNEQKDFILEMKKHIKERDSQTAEVRDRRAAPSMSRHRTHHRPDTAPTPPFTVCLAPRASRPPGRLAGAHNSYGRVQRALGFRTAAGRRRPEAARQRLGDHEARQYARRRERVRGS
eukprot:5647665-Prymnesium_polylepis.1